MSTNSIEVEKENPSFFSLNDFFSLLWKKKYTILILLSLSFVASVSFSYLLPNKYQSSVLMVAAESSETDNLLAKYGGLTAFAGINIPEEVNQTKIALAVIKSKKFTANFIKKRNILIPLIAAKGWDRETNELVIDQNVYNINTQKWVRNVSYPQRKIPSDQESYEVWNKNVFNITEDKKTGFITMTIEHLSPELAKNWAAWLVEDLNNTIRERDVTEAELAIEYLNREVQKTTSEELKTLLYNLIQSHTEKKMLAFSRPDYVFKVIDPPVVSENKISPQRFLIGLLSAFIAVFFYLLYLLVRNFSVKL